MKELILYPLFWTPALCGLGWVLLGILFEFRDEKKDVRSVGEYGIAGLCFLGVFGTLINFFSALSHWTPAFAIVGYLCFAAFCFFRRELVKTYEWGFLFLAVLVIAFTAYCARPVWDMGAYHMPFSKWAYEDPFPIGVGHINKIMGFQSHWFVVGAALTLPWMGWSALFFCDCLLLAFFVSSLIHAAFLKKEKDAESHFSLLILCAFLISNTAATVGANSSDFPGEIYVLSAFLAWVRNPKERRPSHYFLPILWSAFAMVVKMAWVPALAGFVLLFSVLYLTKRLEFKRHRFLLQIALVIFVILPSMVRAVLMTGCYLFPAPQSCIPSIPWALPRAVAENLDVWIKEKAGSVLFFGFTSEYFQYLRNEWFPKFFSDPVVQATLLFLCLATGLALFYRKTKKKHVGLLQRCLECIPILGLCFLFWGALAPNPRFGHAYFLILGCGLLGYQLVTSVSPKSIKRWASVSLIILMALWAKRFYNMSKAEKFHWERPTLIPKQDPKMLVSANGVPYATPTLYAQCWDLPNPCAREPVEGLVIEKLKDGRYYFYSTRPNK